jgi:hypothetical protein
LTFFKPSIVESRFQRPLGLLTGSGGEDGCLRQAFEQYLTSAQFFSQFFRQVISRPQATQFLLGSAALLPLKPKT